MMIFKVTSFKDETAFVIADSFSSAEKIYLEYMNGDIKTMEIMPDSVDNVLVQDF